MKNLKLLVIFLRHIKKHLNKALRLRTTSIIWRINTDKKSKLVFRQTTRST